MDQKTLFELSDDSSYTTSSYSEFTVSDSFCERIRYIRDL